MITITILYSKGSPPSIEKPVVVNTWIIEPFLLRSSPSNNNRAQGKPEYMNMLPKLELESAGHLLETGREREEPFIWSGTEELMDGWMNRGQNLIQYTRGYTSFLSFLYSSLLIPCLTSYRSGPHSFPSALSIRSVIDSIPLEEWAPIIREAGGRFSPFPVACRWVRCLPEIIDFTDERPRVLLLFKAIRRCPIIVWGWWIDSHPFLVLKQTDESIVTIKRDRDRNYWMNG